MAEAETAPTDQDKVLKGIGGWLLVPLALLLCSDVAFIWRMPSQIGAVVAAAHGHWLYSEALNSLLVSVAGISYIRFLLLRFLQRRQETKILVSVFFGLSAAGEVIKGIDHSSGEIVAHPDPSFPWAGIAAVVIFLGLLAYFQTSARVRNTFVRAGSKAKGIGGWLIVPLAYLVLLCAATLYNLAMGGVATSTVYAWHHGHLLAIANNALMVVLLLLSIYCLVRLLQRKREVPWLMLALCALFVLKAGAMLLLFRSNLAQQAMGIVAFNLLLILYFFLSRRVKSTFVR